MYLSTRVWSPTPEWQSLLSVPVGRLDVVWADFSSQVGPSNLGSPEDEVAEDLSVSLGPCAEAVPSFVERFQCWELDPPPPILGKLSFSVVFSHEAKGCFPLSFAPFMAFVATENESKPLLCVPSAI